MNGLVFRRVAATIGSAAVLGGSAAAIAPAVAPAQAAKVKSCGATTIKVKAKGGKTTKFAASRIEVEGGATCQEAIKVIRGVVTKHLPQGWTVARGNYKVPHGLTPQVAVNGRKKVKFALVGGS